jgi:glycosyltransferase involved in cell wall biosynthesis
MRILTHLPALESCGGVELHVLEATRELAGRGHRIALLYERPGNLAAEFGSFCDALRPVRSVRYSDSPVHAMRTLPPAVIASARLHPDLIYTQNFSELAWAVGVRRLVGAPVICHLHEFKPIRPASLALLGRRVSRFVVPSRFMRAVWADHGLDGSRIEVIHGGLDPDAYDPGDERKRQSARARLGLPAEGYIVLYLGRVIPEKGVDVLLEAWRRLGLAPERARLVIVGLPSAPDTYAEALRARSPAGCVWLPMRRDVIEVLRAGDVLVLPSRWEEPFGRVVLEAMATGLPAVASAVGGIPEILDDQFSSMLFAREDAASLAERLSALRDWRRDDPGLGMRCRQHVADNFSLTAAIDRLETVFAGATRG